MRDNRIVHLARSDVIVSVFSYQEYRLRRGRVCHRKKQCDSHRVRSEDATSACPCPASSQRLFQTGQPRQVGTSVLLLLGRRASFRQKKRSATILEWRPEMIRPLVRAYLVKMAGARFRALRPLSVIGWAL